MILNETFLEVNILSFPSQCFYLLSCFYLLCLTYFLLPSQTFKVIDWVNSSSFSFLLSLLLIITYVLLKGLEFTAFKDLASPKDLRVFLITIFFVCSLQCCGSFFSFRTFESLPLLLPHLLSYFYPREISTYFVLP